MTSDLMKITIYPDKDGILNNFLQQRIFSIVDGIIGGENNGLLAPNRKEAGIIIFRGLEPFPNISVYYHSEYPFMGHNREYGLSDVRYVLEESGFVVVNMDTYNGSFSGNSLKLRLLKLIGGIGT